MKRLTPAALTVVMFGIIGALILGYFAKNLWAQKPKPVARTLRDVPIALSDIKPGTVITAEHIGVAKEENEKLPRDTILNKAVIIGRVARELIKGTSFIKAGQLYPAGELPPLDIAPGMRAISVEVGDGVAMVDGLIKPGHTVDVIFTAQGGGSTNDNTYQGGVTMRLFEGVKVLAINRNFTQGKVDRGNNHVTLELTVPQTNIIVLAKDRGKLTLTYNPNGRGDGGLALSNPERVTLFEILGLEKSDPIKSPYMTEIFKGSSRTALQFTEKGIRIDYNNRNQVDPNQNTQYQLPNSNIPNQGHGGSNTNAPQYNTVPQLNSVPSRAINQTTPTYDNQPNTRRSPTAQLIQQLN